MANATIKKLAITIYGDDTGDLENALDEVKRLVSEEFTSGHNSNDSGRFVFDIIDEVRPDAPVKDATPTIVVFRKWKSGGTVIALFPAEREGAGYCSSYEHVGQHGSADYSHVVSQTVKAIPGEYAALRAELESIGYLLEVRQRFDRRRAS